MKSPVQTETSEADINETYLGTEDAKLNTYESIEYTSKVFLKPTQSPSGDLFNKFDVELLEYKGEVSAKPEIIKIDDENLMEFKGEVLATTNDNASRRQPSNTNDAKIDYKPLTLKQIKEFRKNNKMGFAVASSIGLKLYHSNNYCDTGNLWQGVNGVGFRTGLVD